MLPPTFSRSHSSFIGSSQRAHVHSSPLPEQAKLTKTRTRTMSRPAISLHQAKQAASSSRSKSPPSSRALPVLSGNSYNCSTSNQKRKRMIILAGTVLKLLSQLVVVVVVVLLVASASAATLSPQQASSATPDNQTPVQAIRFRMPKWVLAGADRLRLVCDYDLLGQTMHAMKLFKDNKEFYRYTPDGERKLAFPVPGINVDLDRSNGHEVWLRRLDRRSAGEYRCEVSVEETFRSMSMARNLEVRSSAPQPPGSAPIDPSNPSRQQQQQQQQSRQPGLGAGPWNLVKSSSAASRNVQSGSETQQQQQAASRSPQAASSGAATNNQRPHYLTNVNLLVALMASSTLSLLLQVCL